MSVVVFSDVRSVMEVAMFDRRHTKGFEATTYFAGDGSVQARTCCECKELKYRMSFWESRSTNLGIQRRCIKCTKKLRETRYKEKHLRYAKNSSVRWKNANRDRFNEIQKAAYHRRLARKASLPDTLTSEESAEILRRFGNSCALSGEGDDVSLDHVIPLTSGHGGTTKENIVPLSRKLNGSKNNRNLFEWFHANKERFGLEQRKFDDLIAYLADINGMTTEEYEEYVNWCHTNPRNITQGDESDGEAM